MVKPEFPTITKVQHPNWPHDIFLILSINEHIQEFINLIKLANYLYGKKIVNNK